MVKEDDCGGCFFGRILSMVRKNGNVPLRLLPLKNDFVFKLVFGDKRRIDLLTAFLQAVLDLPAEEYEKVTIVDPNVKKEYSNDKAGVLDVKIHTKSGNADAMTMNDTDIVLTIPISF